MLALAAHAWLRRNRAQRVRRASHEERARHATSFANDPGDPLQGLDEASELQVNPLEVDAQSLDDAEAAQDLAGLASEADQIALEEDGDDRAAPVEPAEPVRDAGDLYGAHTPAAVDRVHADDDRAMAEGQNWIEALETSAIENGAEPERELDDIIDDEDVLRPPHPSDLRDTPIADHGSGGRRGL
ncbi:MAG TPA: hypothetical protein VFK02_34625 [Kofleriaceae bacterium]|nr:hypothetical protein [Kofleriaceae bacterium]